MIPYHTMPKRQPPAKHQRHPRRNSEPFEHNDRNGAGEFLSPIYENEHPNDRERMRMRFRRFTLPLNPPVPLRQFMSQTILSKAANNNTNKTHPTEPQQLPIIVDNARSSSQPRRCWHRSAGAPHQPRDYSSPLTTNIPLKSCLKQSPLKSGLKSSSKFSSQTHCTLPSSSRSQSRSFATTALGNHSDQTVSYDSSSRSSRSRSSASTALGRHSYQSVSYSSSSRSSRSRSSAKTDLDSHSDHSVSYCSLKADKRWGNGTHHPSTDALLSPIDDCCGSDDEDIARYGYGDGNPVVESVLRCCAKHEQQHLQRTTSEIITQAEAVIVYGGGSYAPPTAHEIRKQGAPVRPERVQSEDTILAMNTITTKPNDANGRPNFQWTTATVSAAATGTYNPLKPGHCGGGAAQSTLVRSTGLSLDIRLVTTESPVVVSSGGGAGRSHSRTNQTTYSDDDSTAGSRSST